MLDTGVSVDDEHDEESKAVEGEDDGNLSPHKSSHDVVQYALVLCPPLLSLLTCYSFCLPLFCLVIPSGGISGTKIRLQDLKVGMQIMVARRENIKSGNSNWVPQMDQVTLTLVIMCLLLL